ncbi:hypothetical protein NIIDNTM18_40750 [Mycolicibacterium litorale]|uniref:Uncharacterized protein n=1 Tax=Mycolicibacterium litorale TaxID=758802 RepID=A0A6S6PB05_9MYCO|nr:hypothetical protein NIIDNTM18_40750 [Mycolicibacterium litorale]
MEVVVGCELVAINFEEELQAGHTGCGSRELGYGRGEVEDHHKLGIGFTGVTVHVDAPSLQSLLESGELWC